MAALIVFPMKNCSLFFLITSIPTLIVLLQLLSLKNPLSASSSTSGSPSGLADCARKLDDATSRLRDMVTFLPLKDPRFSDTPTEGHTWFMSSVNDTAEPGMPLHLRFPSESSGGRLLCLRVRHAADGASNSYALAWRDSLPAGAALLGGLTFMSETYYDYTNLWHSHSAMVPFAAWHKWKACAVPDRWVLFHWGELRTRVGPWTRSVMEATMGRKMVIESFDRGGEEESPTCFEEAVVFRHNEGSMPVEKRREVYDMMRCKARAHCNVTTAETAGTAAADAVVRMTLFLRSGARSFKDDPAVIGIFNRACDKVKGCRMAVARPDNMTFCEQVKAMSETDVLVTPHGAQLTNMIFMDKGSGVMEFYPKGWLKLAGQGQYVFRWMAEWAGMKHHGSWWDKDDEGFKCPFSEKDVRCFFIHKDAQIGHDEAFFANWTGDVLGHQVKAEKLRLVGKRDDQGQMLHNSDACSCR